ncbi:MAG: UDP-glucose 4-epimerase GalE [Eubacteriales bacterium]|jgi:UDP-glucose 4-epimerase
MAVLITGGTGYIGSHTIVELLGAGYDIVAMDNFSNSKPAVLDRIREITGKRIKFYRADMLDKPGMEAMFRENRIDSCIHFAALKAVGESVEKPLLYYRNNVTGTLNLLELIAKYGVKRFVFSSSATVYGKPASVPIREDFPLSPVNPYGQTKMMVEQILTDLAASDSTMSVVILRYFNPVGAHKSGRLGEDPRGTPSNLMPYITQVAEGRLPYLPVYGNDYDTRDGTGVRDYIHIIDLARAHISALEYTEGHGGVECFNIGTGRGYSVLDIIKAYEKTTGKRIPYQIAPRRPGDIDECYADPGKANRLLGWRAEYDIEDMCRDADRWQSLNPNGF